MSVRLIIMLLAPPLFLLMAAINSLLLYNEETRDIEMGLRGQALAAAVTVAEFARASSDPFAELAAPARMAAMKRATSEIVGLEALYLTSRDGRLLNFIAKPAIVRPGLRRPARAIAIGGWVDPAGDPLIVAVAPAGPGQMVVADIDAKPLADRAFHLKRLSIALIMGSAMLAVLLGLVVARRVSSEFRRTRAIITAHGGGAADRALDIREVRDLADAVGLIEKSVASELEGLSRRRTAGDPALGIAAVRAAHFPDISESHHGMRLAIRILPGAPPGSFHLHSADDDGVTVVIGEVDGEPARALAGAVALRAYMLAAGADTFDARLAAASAAFGVKASVAAKLTAAGTVPLTLREDHAPAFAAYAARNPGLDADALAADLAILYPDSGIIVAAGPA